MPTGSVARFDCRRGYGFIVPDDGGEDVFVHQNNIVMEGFRYLKPGEHVRYELEVGEKGMKAVQVELLDPRPPGDHPFRGAEGAERGGDRGDRGDRGERRSFSPRSAPARRGGGDPSVDKLRRKLERTISVLVEKGMLAPGEIDGLDAAEPMPAETGDQA